MPLLPRVFRVTQNRPLAEGVFALTVEPADGEPMFPFLAGQWVNLHLLNEDGTDWAKTAFSIADAPSETAGSFEIAIKIYGDFTKRAALLKVGDTVKIHGPFGVFVLRPSEAPLVMFAGGIGVSPFVSMIREELKSDRTREVILFYSNRGRNEIAYEEDFRQLEKTYPRFHSIFLLTGPAPAGWDGETGRIDREAIKRHVKDVHNADYLMCGPRPFMDAIRDALESEGVDVKLKLRKELFG